MAGVGRIGAGAGLAFVVVAVAELNGKGWLSIHGRGDDAARRDEKSLAWVAVQVLACAVFFARLGFAFGSCLGLLFGPVLEHGEVQREPALAVGAVQEARVGFLSEPALAAGEPAKARDRALAVDLAVGRGPRFCRTVGGTRSGERGGGG